MIDVLLVNEVGLLRDVIMRVLEDEEDLRLITPATSIEETLERAKGADVALVNTRLPDGDALRLIKQLTKTSPGPKVVVMGLSESETEILTFIEAGANGYVLRDHSARELVARIRAAYEEKALVSAGIAAAMMSRVSELAQLFTRVIGGSSGVGSGTFELTRREEEVLELVSQGLTNREIGDELMITEGTVKNHVHSILQKLDVKSRRAAAVRLVVIR